MIGEKTILEVGEQAPDFQLRDENNRIRTLKEFVGKKLVIYFYPKDNSLVCSAQACNLRDGYDKLRAAGIEIVGISYDSPKSHKKFLEKYQLPFSLLSDENKSVAKKYGAAGGLLGIFGAKRFTFLIDAQQKIVHIFRKVQVNEHADEILNVFAQTG